jgi:hypothetical protein
MDKKTPTNWQEAADALKALKKKTKKGKSVVDRLEELENRLKDNAKL